jgi:hypothetical protein
MLDLTNKTTALDTTATANTLDTYLQNATSLDDLLPPTTTKAKSSKAISIAAFAASYPTKIRPVLVAAAGLLKFFRRGDAAGAIMNTVAFLDLMLVQGEVPKEG